MLPIAGFFSESKVWHLRKRYSECRTLHDELVGLKLKDYHPAPFPKKRLSPLDDDVIAERCRLLQDYLNTATSTMSSSTLMIDFLRVDDHLRSPEEVENARTHAEAANPARLPLHHGFVCNRCKRTPIKGSRFKCVWCFGEKREEFNLCSYCFRDGAHPKESHGFAEVPHPIAAPPPRRRGSAGSASGTRRRSSGSRSGSSSGSRGRIPMTQAARDPSAKGKGARGPVPILESPGTITQRVRMQEQEIMRLQQELAKKNVAVAQLQNKADMEEVALFLWQIHARVPIPVEARIRQSRPNVIRLLFACGAGSDRCYYPQKDAFVAEMSYWQPWLTLAYNGAVAGRSTLGTDAKKALPHDATQAVAIMYDHLTTNNGVKPSLSDLMRATLDMAELAQMERQMRDARYYETMQYDAARDRWQCFVCAGRSRVRSKVRARQKKVVVKEIQGELARLVDDKWVNQYAAFNPKRLLVYASKQDSLKQPLDVLEVDDILDCRAADPIISGRAFSFTVTTRTDTLVFAASTQADFDSWVNVISAAIL